MDFVLYDLLLISVSFFSSYNLKVGLFHCKVNNFFEKHTYVK